MSKPGDQFKSLEHVYAEREMQPVLGTIKLYDRAIEQILDKWPSTDTAELQHQIYEVNPDAILFSLWQHLYHAKSDPEVNQAKEYLSSIRKALQALAARTASAKERELVADLGTKPKRIVRSYEQLLEKVS